MFAVGVSVARERLAELGPSEMLPQAPYAAFLTEIGGPDSDELHDLIIRATLDGSLSPLQRWLEDRYGPGEFAALFRSVAYSKAV